MKTCSESIPNIFHCENPIHRNDVQKLGFSTEYIFDPTGERRSGLYVFNMIEYECLPIKSIKVRDNLLGVFCNVEDALEFLSDNPTLPFLKVDVPYAVFFRL